MQTMNVTLTGEEINGILIGLRQQVVKAISDGYTREERARSQAYEQGVSDANANAHNRFASGIRSILLHVREGNKIGAIRMVRELTHLGLKEAKDLVEECQGPQVIKTVDVNVVYNGHDYLTTVREYHIFSGVGKLLVEETHPGKKAAMIAARTMVSVYRAQGYTVHKLFS